MSKRSLLSTITLLAAVLTVGCTRPESSQPLSAQDLILVNQLGYPMESAKRALVRKEGVMGVDGNEVGLADVEAGDVARFTVRNAAGEIVLEGNVSEPLYWEMSGDAVGIADFSELRKPGQYTLCVLQVCSYPFRIGDVIYKDLADASLKSYYYARAGVDIEKAFGGIWHYKGGHPDTAVFIHTTAADNRRPANTTISSPGGWYDAGDYGKYIVNSGITTWTLVQSLRLNREFHEQQNTNIPESGNSLPDILDEALVNLRWMLTMQDPNDGGVYHKLTTKEFDTFIMPAATSKPRYIVMKSTAATLDFAATMANASRTVKAYGLDDLAKEMEQAADNAWGWAIDHPDVFYVQPEDIFTGTYADTSLTDEWFWASAEMYLMQGAAQKDATKQGAAEAGIVEKSSTDEPTSVYREKLITTYQSPLTPKWDRVNTLGLISLLTSDRRSEFPEMEREFMAHVDWLLEQEARSPYLVSLDRFAWGSNSDVANDGMLKLVAYQLTDDPTYVASAQNDLDYILGRNATGYSFVTGFGDKTPMHPHNRIMGADGIELPIPGFIAGGPNVNVLTDCEVEGVIRSKYPAASFTDTLCSYSTNETAINWNAPLVYLSSGLEYFYSMKQIKF